jgi:PKD domain
MGSALRRRPWLLWLLLLGLAVLAVGLVAVMRARADHGGHGEALAKYGFRMRQEKAKESGESEGGSRHGAEEREVGESGGEAEREKKGEKQRNPHEAAATILGHEGGEGSRHGARTPWGEQVGNRAYPRSYVDDRLAVKSRRAFERTPSSAPRSAFKTGKAYRAARAAAPGSWAGLGPITPNVSGQASQFFDPVTQKGPPTQESGRVSAIAVDPACAQGDCRVWIAAAGGGIWRTADATALHPQWIAPPSDLPTTAFGSLNFDAAHNTLYAGSGEPNGSSDSEAGLGLFKSTDGGASWTLVPGSAAVATNRSIGAIATDPRSANTIYIGTAVARHGSSSSNGGRRTPPNAPALGVYKSTDGGATFTRETDLSNRTPADPTPPASGNDFFAGGITRLELDPNDPDAVYAGVLGYGVWRSADAGATWAQVFHTINQNDFSNPDAPVGDSGGDITQFDLVDLGTATRAYLGDASDDFAADGDDGTPLPQVFRNDDVAAIAGSPAGDHDNSDWTELSNATNGTPGFAAYGWCQNGQCSYDAFVVSPPGHPDEVWLGGSMNYDELPAYAGQPPRSNGRAVIRSTNANGTAASTTWQDMTAVLSSNDAWHVTSGLHPDEHSIGFSADGNMAFNVSDGGVARVDVTDPVDRSGSCANRRYVYDADAGPVPLNAADLADCQMLLSAIPDDIAPLNDGLDDLQFQSLSFNPKNPGNDVQGGTQDNGTWSFTGSPAWFESVGGDGGQSGFNADDPTVRYHNYFDATPEVNFHGNDPDTWLDIYDELQTTDEGRSFYTPFIADPVTPGRVFTGLEHVWRTDDNGGNESALKNSCNALHLVPGRSPCGDWAPMGPNLTSDSFGDRAGQYVVATTRAAGDDSTLWAGTRIGRVFISRNADAPASAVDFRRLDTGKTPGRFVSGIAVDPSDALHAWVSYAGYGAYTPESAGHVFDVRYSPSTHQATWTDISGNLGDQPITSVALNAETGDLYAGTDFGVLRLPSGSSSWEAAAPGMPHVAVYGLTVSQSGHLLYAATHGRGAYRLALPLKPPAGGGTGGTGGTGGSAPPPGTTPPAATTDKVRPTLTVSKIKTVRRPKRSTIKGRARDASGIRSVTLRFGDGKRKRSVKLTRSGRFTVRHRYGTPARYEITVTASDRAGNSRTRHRTARVRSRPS